MEVRRPEGRCGVDFFFVSEPLLGVCNQWQVGNILQLHQLHILVEHLLRSSRFLVEWS